MRARQQPEIAMTATTRSTTSDSSPEQSFVLDDVDWTFYETLLDRVADRHVFVTYDRGRLELMSPSFRHDKRARCLGLLVNIVAEELGIPLQGGGSTTFRRKDLDKGLEPDQCFYVKNVNRIVGREAIDLAVDPPPDLAIEVEISRRMIKRVPLYESMGVPELWRDDGNHVRVFQLGADGTYQPATRSPSFPTFPLDQLDHLLELARTTDEMNWMRTVRQWVRSNVQA
jgi:Uma2 family endonuclease